MKRRLTFIGVLAVLGCRPEREGQAQAASEARARETAQAVASGAAAHGQESSVLTPEQRNTVAARVGDRTITLGDFERELQAMPTFVRARYGTPERKSELLHTLVQFEVLAAEAQAKGLDSDPEVMQAVKLAMVEKLLVDDVSKLAKASSVTEEEIARAYENRKADFVRPEAVRVSYIRIKEKATADGILGELRSALAGDAREARAIFGDFVRRHTTDTSTFSRNGDLGFLTRDGYLEGGALPRLEGAALEALFAMPGPGVVSDVHPVGAEFAIFQVTSRRPAITKTLADARLMLTNSLLREKQDRVRRDYIEGLRAKAKVQIDEAVLGSIDVGKIRTATSAARPVTAVMEPPAALAQPPALPPALELPEAAAAPAAAAPAAAAPAAAPAVAAPSLITPRIRSREVMNPADQKPLDRRGKSLLPESEREKLIRQRGVNP